MKKREVAAANVPPKVGSISNGTFTDEHRVSYRGELARVKYEEAQRRQGYVPTATGWNGNEVRLTYDPHLHHAEQQKAKAAQDLTNAQARWDDMSVRGVQDKGPTDEGCSLPPGTG